MDRMIDVWCLLIAGFKFLMLGMMPCIHSAHSLTVAWMGFSGVNLISHLLSALSGMQASRLFVLMLRFMARVLRNVSSLPVIFFALFADCFEFVAFGVVCEFVVDAMVGS